MFESWSLRTSEDDGVAIDLASARGLLPALRLRLDTQGNAGERFYGQGVAEVADIVAVSLGVTDATSLTGRGLEEQTLDQTYRDLLAGLQRCREAVERDGTDVRAAADRFAFGCLLLLHLYRLRFHALTAPIPQRAAAEALAEAYADLAGRLANTASWASRSPA